MYFLTINAGSSSIKFSLFHTDTLAEEYTGTLSGIGFDVTTLRISGAQSSEQNVVAPDHKAAIRVIQEWLQQNAHDEQIAAIGHRVVHGGPNYDTATRITDKVVQTLRDIVPLDTAHLPTQIAIIEHLGAEFPNIVQFACFDTAFFHNLPTNARLLPLPRHLEAEGVRRYGFHGLSYSYLLAEFERCAGTAAAHGKVVFAHLGNGASLAAVVDGKPVDTSMGMTPAGGIPMSTRTGDLDPGVLTYLAAQKGLNPEQIDHLVNFESGLLGISGIGSDMKKLLELMEHEPHAQEAVDIFCYNVRKQIGAYAAAMGGINSLVFSGGIGEVSATIRSRICEGLGFLGITLDEHRNKSDVERTSADGAAVGVHVLSTNEALTIARELQQLTKNEG